MKVFFGRFFAAFTAYIIGGLILFFIMIGVTSSILSRASETEVVEVENGSILNLHLTGSLSERSGDGLLDNIRGNKKTSLKDILKALKSAEKDDRIKGVYLTFDMTGGGGYASLESIREALIAVKKAKKFIAAYAEVYNEKAYYLASVADRIFLNPMGAVEWNGLGSTPMFYKGLLAKLEVEPKVFRVGTFKSAVEPFILDKMSDANRLQTQTFLSDFWNHIVQKIAESRNIPAADLNGYASNLDITVASTALDKKMVDQLAYQDEVLDWLKSKTGVTKEEKLRTISITNYAKDKKINKNSSNKIAIVYAVGDIVDGKGDDNSVGSETFVKSLREAKEDKSVKAIVIRVNSPGGSALASDIMTREIILTKKIKPVIISQGDLAASGGYYISAFGDVIVAQPTTITGSIGVFGLLFSSQKLFNNKLGITFDRVTTNPYADLGNLNRPMDEKESKTIQSSVNKIYGDFLGVVQRGRKFSDSLAVDAIAQGRVWSGMRAKQLGLVDELGGLDKAIEIAAKKAGLGEDFQTIDFPAEKTTAEKITQLLDPSKETKILENIFTEEQILFLQRMNRLRTQSNIYMWDPQSYEID